ncbi:hypothetical protein B0H66DRAFT_600525 [Apodospora peruviana]|uniref:Uncharacterized protein n=1 Tax=Apodospora peruviana TaxID=516989 RepID=A0AAE0IJZ6_9PEZI|nr:hypothetical protein B0H66DRAFT_600525 [Apodospora peruviana]
MAVAKRDPSPSSNPALQPARGSVANAGPDCPQVSSPGKPKQIPENDKDPSPPPNPVLQAANGSVANAGPDRPQSSSSGKNKQLPENGENRNRLQRKTAAHPSFTKQNTPSVPPEQSVLSTSPQAMSRPVVRSPESPRAGEPARKRLKVSHAVSGSPETRVNGTGASSLDKTEVALKHKPTKKLSSSSREPVRKMAPLTTLRRLSGPGSVSPGAERQQSRAAFAQADVLTNGSAASSFHSTRDDIAFSSNKESQDQLKKKISQLVTSHQPINAAALMNGHHDLGSGSRASVDLNGDINCATPGSSALTNGHFDCGKSEQYAARARATPGGSYQLAPTVALTNGHSDRRPSDQYVAGEQYAARARTTPGGSYELAKTAALTHGHSDRGSGEQYAARARFLHERPSWLSSDAQHAFFNTRSSQPNGVQYKNLQPRPQEPSDVNMYRPQPPRPSKSVDTTLLDILVYQQEGAATPPYGVTMPDPTPPSNPNPPDEPVYADIDPHIHWPQPHSDAWLRQKQEEIKARGKRKANFGKAAHSMKKQRLMEEPVSFLETLPDKVLDNSAWVRVLKKLDATSETPGNGVSSHGNGTNNSKRKPGPKRQASNGSGSGSVPPRPIIRLKTSSTAEPSV